MTIRAPGVTGALLGTVAVALPDDVPLTKVWPAMQPAKSSLFRQLGALINPGDFNLGASTSGNCESAFYRPLIMVSPGEAV